MAASREAGVVGNVSIYPFKGMQGIRMRNISLRSVSVVGDRQFAFNINSSTGTPSLLDTTKFSGLLAYSTSLVDPNAPRTSEVKVKTPDGEEFSARDPRLTWDVSERAGKVLSLVSLGRAAYHSMPVSLLGTASIADIENELGGRTIDQYRFRENLLLVTDTPYIEDRWEGSILRFGDTTDSAMIMVIKPDERCATVNMDPKTGEQDPEVLKTIVRVRNNRLGMYATIVREGLISEGEKVDLISIPK